MKLILTSTVDKLGIAGDVVEVKDGYGRNFLLPQGYAMLATPANLKVFELERRKLQVKVEAERGQAASLADKIHNTPVTIAMRVGENDKLYGSVTTALIADALADKGIEIDRRRILLDTPIRLLGDYKVRVRLHANVTAEVPLAVVAERAIIEDEQPKEAVADAAEPAPAEAAE